MAKFIIRAGKIGITCLLLLVMLIIGYFSAKVFVLAEDSTLSVDALSEAITISGYSVDPNVSSTDSLDIADYCFRTGNDYQARVLYEQIVGSNTSEDVSLKAHKGIVLLDEKITDPNYVRYTVADIKSEYSNNENMPDVICEIAEYYRAQALKIKNKTETQLADTLIAQAIPLLEESIANIDDAQKPDTYLRLAESYSRLGDYQQSLEYYEELVDKYPDYEKVWHVYFLMGRCYEKLASSGDITYAQAIEQISPIYTYLIQEYPDCKAAKAANNWLAFNVQ